MLLDELPIFEHIKNDILSSVQQPTLQSLSNGSNVHRNNSNSNGQRKNAKRVGLIPQRAYKQPPLSAYSAIDTRPFLTRRPLNEGGILIERRRVQLAATRKLGIRLFRPIGYRYRNVKSNELKRDGAAPLDINDISRGSDLIMNNDNLQRPEQIQFHESSGLMINMDGEGEEGHNSLIVPRNMLSGGSQLLSDMNESNEYDDINTMENINIEQVRPVVDMPNNHSEPPVNSSGIEPMLTTTTHSFFESSIPRLHGENWDEEEENSDKSMDEYLNDVEDEDW
ncbi:hypothetical protein MOSE0_I09296 [Monosporozyma servazzii]